ncbi:MAG: citrate synthase [Phycisphaerae bacterium]|nr:citrate synthase [Phycisphaerae bacterium]
MTERAEGLRNVIVSDSKLSHVDGEAGQLIYRGYPIEELAEKVSFEEAAYLLWHGYLPTKVDLQDLKASFRLTRPLEDPMKKVLRTLPKGAQPMSLLRTAVSAAGLLDQKADRANENVTLEVCERMTAKAASIVAAQWRLRIDEDIIEPHAKLDHAANFLYMLNGVEPTELQAKVFDVCLVLHMDHGFNASTFAGRVTASTLSDIYSSVTTAIGTLRGRLHGGANTAVMEMLQEIERPERAEAYVKDLLAKKQRVMGFGHAVYKVIDPRAVILRRLARELADSSGQTKWIDMCDTIENVMTQEKGICCNVDFYSGPVYHMLGIHSLLFTPIFAMSRIVGYTAHILEQYRNNKIIRPKCQYVGDVDRTFVPIKER